MRLATERLFGLDFVAASTIDEVGSEILREIAHPTASWLCVVTPNVDHLVRYAKAEVEFDVARRATFILPDGMPIVWASRLLRRPLRSRLAGSDLFPVVWRALARDRISTVVVAPSQDVADLLGDEHPRLRSIVPPMFDADDALALTQIVDQIARAVDESQARTVIIALSTSKSHLLVSGLQQRWSSPSVVSPMVLLLGASPMFYLGLTKRAPEWMRRMGLEWLHRLLHDPRRLAKRYLVEDTMFVRLVWRDWRGRYEGRWSSNGSGDHGVGA